MSTSLRAPDVAAKRSAEKDVQPPLRVNLIGPQYRWSTKPVHEGHPLYGVLATLWHHGSTIPEPARLSLLCTVLAGLPATPGRNADKYNNVLVAAAASSGASHDDIAMAWSIDRKSVPKKIRAGRLALASPFVYDPQTRTTTLPGWSIEPVLEQSEIDAPRDPASDSWAVFGEQFGPSWRGISEDERAAALARFWGVLDAGVAAGRLVKSPEGAYRSAA